MIRFLMIIPLVVALGGCNLPAIFQASTASIGNPVTPAMLKEVEDGATVAFAGLRAYKTSCVQLAIPQSCRDVIQKIQVYTRKLPPLLTSVRAFVRNNDQVNAVIAYNAITGLIADFKTEAANNSVQVQ